MQCKFTHHQDQCLDGEKSPKHSHLFCVPAVCPYAYTHSIAQISEFPLQGIVREQHPWEARSHVEWSLPGLSGSGAFTISAACTNFKTIWSDTKPASAAGYNDAHGHCCQCCSWPTTTNESCLAKATLETLCYIPPKLLANSGNLYCNWSKVGKSAIS